jgi:hypothetical protein
VTAQAAALLSRRPTTSLPRVGTELVYESIKNITDTVSENGRPFHASERGIISSDRSVCLLGG